MSAIPSVDLSDFISGDPSRKQKFIKEIGAAFEDIGFVALSGHFLSDELVKNTSSIGYIFGGMKRRYSRNIKSR